MFVCVKRKYVRVGELVLVIVNLYNFQKKALFFCMVVSGPTSPLYSHF